MVERNNIMEKFRLWCLKVLKEDKWFFWICFVSIIINTFDVFLSVILYILVIISRFLS
jgi:hypothetical protein